MHLPINYRYIISVIVYKLVLSLFVLNLIIFCWRSVELYIPINKLIHFTKAQYWFQNIVKVPGVA